MRYGTLRGRVPLFRKARKSSSRCMGTSVAERLSAHRENGQMRIAPAADLAGFLLVDERLSPFYVNDEAVKILTYPRNSHTARASQKLLIQKIQALFAKVDTREPFLTVKPVESGRRTYLCRPFPISRSPDESHQPAIALLIERNSRSGDLLQLAEEFNLTQRERETVQLLAQGLTTKEIAARMGISPNTVKAFMRLVMIKTGTTTRSGIIGRFLRGI
jgi:DNA-binding CsgD family transcriptional regulator